MSTATIRLKDGTLSVNRGNKFKDLIGKVFGKLTVVALDEAHRMEIRWVCKCACGKIKSILPRALRQGQASCGCALRFDLTGKHFGRLVVEGFAGDRLTGKHGRTTPTWKCVCKCGSVKEIRSTDLLSGNTRSCGCLAVDVQLESHVTHGATIGRASREYRIWSNMKNRCSNPNSNRYHIYGGRGISVCDRWGKSFENFFQDMGKCPAGMSIERKNTNGNYEPSNCKWVTVIEQANNTRTNRFLTALGETLTLSQWARKTGIKIGTISGRIKRGWCVDVALTTPLKS